MIKYFVASDIHSYFDIFHTELLKMGFEINNPEHKLVVCGDLFDRGDQTVELFRFVQSLGDRFIYIRGNHEDLLFDCMKDIRCGRVPDSHHFHNQTVKTICQFCGQSEQIVCAPIWRDKICDIMNPILDWIDTKCVNYFEIGDNILVHGWIPMAIEDKLPYYYAKNRKLGFKSDWKNATKAEWAQARWLNGIDTWFSGGDIEGKTIICGHWHCSYGWSHIDRKYKEFPNPNHADFEHSFKPWVKTGIIAIDACTAYSKKCNVIIIEEGEDDGDD